MADSPFSNPTIHASIAADVSRIQSTWLEWNAESTTGDFHTKIVETLVDSLDAHVRRYLEAVDGSSRLREYQDLLRRVGSALIENAEQRSVLSDTYSEDCLRKMAENAGDFISRKHSLTPEQRETEICNVVERIRSEVMPEALKWHKWKSQLPFRIETRFEARYRHWTAEAIERALRQMETPTKPAEGGLPKANQAGSTEPSGNESTRAEAGPGVYGTSNGTDRRKAVDAFISKLAEAGQKITRKSIWTVAGYTHRTEFERFQRGDTRTTRSAASNFNRVLGMKPEDFVLALQKRKTPK
jgi:hypothetical protein